MIMNEINATICTAPGDRMDIKFMRGIEFNRGCQQELIASEIGHAHKQCLFHDIHDFLPANTRGIVDDPKSTPDQIRTAIMTSDILRSARCLVHTGQMCALVLCDAEAAGSPCQDHSTFGSRAGMSGPRASAFWTWCRIQDLRLY